MYLLLIHSTSITRLVSANHLIAVKYVTKKPTQNTSNFIEHINLSRKDKTISTTFETQTKKNNNTRFAANLYSAGTEHGNLHRYSVMTSKVICLILPVHTGTGVTHSKHNNNRKQKKKKTQNKQTQERFWKIRRWMDRKGMNQQGRNPWQ